MNSKVLGRTLLRWTLFASLASPLGSIAGASEQPSVLDGTSYLYLRCNSTGWNLTPETYLKPTSNPELFELSYEVKETWMLQQGDDCTLTGTPLFNQWGNGSKQFVLIHSTLQAPDSARIIASNSNSGHNFKVRYPSLGRYKAIYNAKEQFLSIRKEGPIESGDVDWTVPGNFLKDDQGQLFLQSYYPRPSFAKIDPTSGRTIWNLATTQTLAFTPACSEAGSLFVTYEGKVASINPKDGSVRWQQDLGGSLQEASGFLSCYARSPYVFITHGASNSVISALDKRTGDVAWSFEGPEYLSLQGSDGRVLIYNAFSQDRNVLSALTLKDGAKAWDFDYAQGWFTLSPDSKLYSLQGDTVKRLDALTGETLWTYQGLGEWIYLSFEKGRTYINQRNKIARIDSETGRDLWTYDYNNLADLYPYASVLRSGEILIRASDYSAGSSITKVLDGSSGQLLWEHDWRQPSSFLTQDNNGGSYIIEGNTLKSVDIRSGQVAWTYKHEASAPHESLFGYIEQDSSTIYLAYGISVSKYPPMGIVALDAKTGAVRWKSFQNAPFSFVTSDSQHIFINVGVYSGSAKAIRK